MGAIGDKFDEVYRDFATDGVKSSGPHNPKKAEQREIGSLIESAISNAALGALVDVAYATRAELEADLAHADATVGLVHSDPVDANNDLYVKSGASGAGAWALTTILHDSLSGQVADLEAAVDAAVADVEALKLMTRLSFGEYLAEATPTVSLGSNGAQATPGTSHGITIPVGVTGNGAYVRPAVPTSAFPAGALKIGDTASLAVTVKTSDVFTRAIATTLQVKKTDNTTEPRAITPKVIRSVVGLQVIAFDFVWQGNEKEIRPWLQLATATNTASEETYEIVEIRLTVNGVTYLGETTADRIAALREAELEGRVHDELSPTIGNLIADESFNFSGSEENGATYEPRSRTLTIPDGFSGDNALLLSTWDVDGKTAKDRQCEFLAEFAYNTGFDRLPDKAFFRAFLINGTDEFRLTDTPIELEDVPAEERFRARFVYTFKGDEKQVQPYCQLDGSGSLAEGDQTIQLIKFVPEFLTSADTALTPAEANMEARDKRFMGAPRIIRYSTPGKNGIYDEKITVSRGGGADFTDPCDAAEAIELSGPTNRFEIELAPATRFEIDREFAPPAYTDVKGFGGASLDTIVQFFRDDSATKEQIDTDSVIRLQWTSRTRGVGYWGRNVRYAGHFEIPLVGFAPNAMWDIEDYDFRHFGNPSPNNERQGTSQAAMGIGLNSGQHLLIGAGYAWSKLGSSCAIHNLGVSAGPADEPSVVMLRRAILIPGTESGRSISIASIGSRQPDVLQYDDCVIPGKVVIDKGAWKRTEPEHQPANHHEFSVTARGNTPHVVEVSDTGEALRITSASDGAASRVTISGNAVKHLFGNTVTDHYYTRDGSAGLAGQVHGWGDVAGLSLGARLGDCTTTSKTLTVAIDGGADVDIVFSGDHSLDDNATILATINAALGAAATADTFSPGALWRPRILDEERAMLNASASAILRGMALANDFETDGGGAFTRAFVRPMTSADDRTLFAGIAIEDIAVEDMRRVKHSGWLPIGDVLRSDPGVAFVYGDTFSIDPANPGQIVLGGAQGLLKCVRPGVVEVG